ncbi:unnamed protein product [Euphydryas editha]|uniref:Reverse transcriptase domain-containing protein n=1 Tax=Euphydryas editha TaxID=104508 RepID=A0AAU9TU55_EUPED|nr:unnamed protein product [Euphydryas editha]
MALSESRVFGRRVNSLEMYCRVPQGSVLGPLLWNLAYDDVLRVDLPDSVSIVSYTDETLVLASEKN